MGRWRGLLETGGGGGGDERWQHLHRSSPSSFFSFLPSHSFPLFLQRSGPGSGRFLIPGLSFEGRKKILLLLGVAAALSVVGMVGLFKVFMLREAATCNIFSPPKRDYCEGGEGERGETAYRSFLPSLPLFQEQFARSSSSSHFTVLRYTPARHGSSQETKEVFALPSSEDTPNCFAVKRGKRAHLFSPLVILFSHKKPSSFPSFLGCPLIYAFPLPPCPESCSGMSLMKMSPPLPLASSAQAKIGGEGPPKVAKINHFPPPFHG